MSGPAYFSGGMNIAKNWDWVQAFIYGSVNSDTQVFTPIDLTGSILRLMIKKNELDHEALVYVTSEDGSIEITDAPGGAFTIIIVRDKLRRLYVGSYVADLIRVRAADDGMWERLWDASPVEVSEGVTRL
jgi:hypothetical protein